MIRILYSIAWWLSIPVALSRLWWRGRNEKGYRQHLGERIGFYRSMPFDRSNQTIWVHAVSVGETRAAEPIIDALLSAYPDHAILLTYMTPTGRATGNALFGKYTRRVMQSYMPYDTAWMAARFLAHFSPKICILMETEVWPNMIAQCQKFHVPILLANARLSERSFKKALRLSGLFLPAAKGITCAAAQTEEDAIRLRTLGVGNVQVTGSVKFDVSAPDSMLDLGAQMRTRIGSRKIFLCASTREGEEALILESLKEHDMKGILLIIVPRHPQRFNDVERLIEGNGLRICRRSALDNAPLSPDIHVMLGDTMGEMFAYYAACDLAFIGGSLLPLGGQNLIEACAVGKPVLVGPHTFNFSAVADNAIAAGAAVRVVDADAMLTEATRLLSDDATRNEMGANAKRFAEQHRGATQRTFALLEKMLAESLDERRA